MASTSSASFQPMDRNQVLYRATLQDAAAGGALLMGKLVASARKVLHARETETRDLRVRDALVESAKLLRTHESVLCQRFPVALARAFEAPRSDGRKAVIEDVQFDQLELMDESEVLSSVAMARMRQMSVLASESSLLELNGLMAHLQGLGTVQSDTNPLRPESYIAALNDVLRPLPIASAMRLEWVAAMGDCMARELAALYAVLCTRLRREGVVQAGYAHPTPVTQQTAPASKEQTLLTLDKLRRLLSGELEDARPVSRVEQFSAQFAHMFENAPQPEEDAAPTDFAATVPAAFEALTEMRQVDRVLQTLEQRQAGVAEPPTAGNGIVAVRTALRTQARGMAQALSLEVVSLMVDNMARDARLLAPVQALVRSIEPALLQLALVDPRFFTDKHHSARKLLQEITQRSMAFGSVAAPGLDAFLGGVREALQPLLHGPMESAEPFEAALQQLLQRWARVSKDQASQRDAAVEALSHAESRNVLAEKIARGIEAHPDSGHVPAVVINFLCGPWAQVVAQARLREGAGAEQADKYQALIPALLWSAHPDLAKQSPAKLMRLVPRLLSTLREGLETVHYPATMTSAFLESLMQIHQRAFRAYDDPGAVLVEVPEPASPDAEAPARAQWIEQGNPWVAPGEAASSNFVELAEMPAPSPGAEAAAPASAPASESVQPLHDADFPLGCWVEWKLQGEWVRTQLSWASPHGTLFLFTSAFGTTQSMTRRTRDRLIATGDLRLISGQPVLDGALNAVAQAAMRNSVDSAY